MTIKYILSNFPLRLIISDYCNLNCFFCSNEGLPLSQKNKTHASIESLKFLINVLVKNGLKNIALTGGEPSTYPPIKDLIRFINKFPFEQKFFHTNGILLGENLINGLLENFTKIAISVHAFEPTLWQKITGGSLLQYEMVLKNLFLLRKRGLSSKVEIKHVVIKGFNDSKEIIKKTIDFCAENNFKFKFLNFEPIRKEQIGLAIPIEKMRKKLEQLGCEPLPLDSFFRGQSSYLPLIWYRYKNIKGVLIEIGCGESWACESCYLSNEIVVTPFLEIKPCHMSNIYIPLASLIKNKDEEGILDAVRKSREILKEKPGLNKSYWNQS